MYDCFPIFEMLFSSGFEISQADYIKHLKNSKTKRHSSDLICFVEKCYERSKLAMSAHFHSKNNESLLHSDNLPTDVFKIIYKLFTPFNSSWSLMKKNSVM